MSNILIQGLEIRGAGRDSEIMGQKSQIEASAYLCVDLIMLILAGRTRLGLFSTQARGTQKVLDECQMDD